MTDRSILVLIVLSLVFAGVALVAHVVAGSFARRVRLRQRFGSVSMAGATVAGPGGGQARLLAGVDPARLGVDAGQQRKLRRDLVRAGYFNPNAVAVFTIARWVLLLFLPVLGLIGLAAFAGYWEAIPKIAFAATLLIVAYYLPRAFLSRRQRLLEERYRLVFPDFLDMLVVCVNAGLSLDAALERVTRELGTESYELRANLELMAGEMRAGKGTVEALKDCAERLGLPEARALATLLQQSIELGTDVALALTTFSDEMREKRMARAEQKAAALPPKLTFPLAAFIFPVVLMVILTPVVLKIMKASAN